MDHSKADHKNQPSRGELFIVATPIGNLGDITLRAIETLKSVNLIACEDTRVSGGLLHHYGIKVPMLSYHTHNEAKVSAELVGKLQRGERIALITDAGTPLVSDPGARLVAEAIAAGIRVTPIPGASALLTGLMIAGLPTTHFFFGGFLPNKKGERVRLLESWATLPTTLVVYEAPHRLLASLADLALVFGDREAAVARELTKLHEECRRAPLSALHAHYTAHPPRGECVIVIAGASAEKMMDDASLDAALAQALGTKRLKEAVDDLLPTSGRTRRDVYARALAIKNAS